MTQAGVPEGARTIDVNEFLVCIGELYFQNWVLRQTMQKQQQQASSNGQLVGLEPKG